MLRVTNDDVDQDRQQAGVLHTWFMGGDIMTAAMRLEGKYYEMIMLCQYVNTKRQICQEGDRSEGACRRARHLRLSDSSLLTRQDQ